MMDHYQTLGVARDASTEAIRDAFRELTRQHHPDVGGGAEAERFQQVVTAYDVLRDPESRARYDAEMEAAAGVRTPHFTWSNIAQPRGVKKSRRGAAVVVDEKPDLDAMIDAYVGKWNDPE